MKCNAGESVDFEQTQSVHALCIFYYSLVSDCMYSYFVISLMHMALLYPGNPRTYEASHNSWSYLEAKINVKYVDAEVWHNQFISCISRTI